MVAIMWSPFVNLAKDAPALVAADIFAVVGGHAVLADSGGFATPGFASKLASIALVNLALCCLNLLTLNFQTRAFLHRWAFTPHERPIQGRWLVLRTAPDVHARSPASPALVSHGLI